MVWYHHGIDKARVWYFRLKLSEDSAHICRWQARIQEWDVHTRLVYLIIEHHCYSAGWSERQD